MKLDDTQHFLEKMIERAEDVAEFSEKISKQLEKAEKEMLRIEKLVQKCEDEKKVAVIEREVEKVFSYIEYKLDDMDSVRSELDGLERLFRRFQEGIEKAK